MQKNLPDVEKFTKEKRLELEKEVLGVYITGHPLEPYREKIDRFSTISTDMLNGDLGETDENSANHIQQNDGKNLTLKNNSHVVICGLVASMRKLMTKSSQLMAFVNLEDLYGTCEIVVFPKVYHKATTLLESGEPLVVVGRINMKEDAPPAILADEIKTLDEAVQTTDTDKISELGQNLETGKISALGKPHETGKALETGKHAEITRASETPAKESPVVKLRVTKEGVDAGVLEDIERLIIINSGKVDVRIYLPEGKKIRAKSGVEISDFLAKSLYRLLGEDNVKIPDILGKEV